MSTCRHLNRIKEDVVCVKISDPSQWKCSKCGTTDDVWACLSCGWLSCKSGRCEKHAREHAQEHKHPLVLEVNTHACHCYLCDDSVANDTRKGCLAKIRAVLEEVATGVPAPSRTRKGALIRKGSARSKYDKAGMDMLAFTGLLDSATADHLDHLCTSIRMWAEFQQRVCVNTWRKMQEAHKAAQQVTKRGSGKNKIDTSSKGSGTSIMQSPSELWSSEGRCKIIRGRTGLRNLGNTCYLNAVLQCLSHIKPFRNMFYNGYQAGMPALPELQRTTTTQCYEELKDKSGFQHLKRTAAKKKLKQVAKDHSDARLFEEVHHLLRVLWSGKYAVVTPNSVVSSVWTHAAAFRGFKQQDATEFFVFLIDKLSEEILEAHPAVRLREYFEASVCTTVECHSCGNRSSGHKQKMTTLPAALPLEYYLGKAPPRRGRAPNTLPTMLQSFFGSEELDADNAVRCSKCKKKGPATLRKELTSLPKVLTCQIQRTSFLGGKVSEHVDFPLEGLDLAEFVPESVAAESSTMYDLVSVVVHHGKHQDRGHYTAIGLNDQKWVSFNDEKASVMLSGEVKKTQALMLLYIQRDSIKRVVPQSSQAESTGKKSRSK